jgi:hypothetical protein
MEMMTTTSTLMMNGGNPQMTMLTTTNHDPQNIDLTIGYLFPCVKSLRHHNLALFKGA